jgi:tRNA threonylcarbamoyladenosine biosynthesis protein TsaE
MPLTLKLQGLEDLPNIASQIIQFGKQKHIWLFEGHMGAGKTTLIKEICQQLGVENSIGSPTYSLVNEYVTTHGKTLYHFDFYRLKKEMEALDYGLEEYFDSGNLCLCEWPSKIPNLWPLEYLMIKISADLDGSRQISLDLH